MLRGAGGDRPFDGGRETGADISWCDAQLTIFHEQPVFSPSQRFAVLGDLWLSNCDPLRDRLGVAPIPDAQLVAHLWERWGVDALGLLEGIFALVVWGREYLRLYLARDRAGGPQRVLCVGLHPDSAYSLHTTLTNSILSLCGIIFAVLLSRAIAPFGGMSGSYVPGLFSLYQIILKD